MTREMIKTELVRMSALVLIQHPLTVERGMEKVYGWAGNRGLRHKGDLGETLC